MLHDVGQMLRKRYPGSEKTGVGCKIGVIHGDQTLGDCACPLLTRQMYKCEVDPRNQNATSCDCDQQPSTMQLPARHADAYAMCSMTLGGTFLEGCRSVLYATVAAEATE